MEAIMKRTILAIALALSSAVGAHADTSTYVWQGKGPWTDAQLQSAAQVCDQHYGVVENGAITSANYKRCKAGNMAARPASRPSSIPIQA
jgi:hypothetical protein